MKVPYFWMVSCMLWEVQPRNSQRTLCRQLFRHDCSSDAWRMVTQIWASRFCCWTYLHTPLTHSAYILSWLSVVASTLEISGNIRQSSSPQAEQARDSVTHSIPSAADLIPWILIWFTLRIRAFVAIERICVDQLAFKGFASRSNDLDWKLFSPSSPHFSLHLLHQCLQLRPRGWRDENAGFPEISKPVPVLPPLLQPASAFFPAFGTVNGSHSILFSLKDFRISLETRLSHFCSECLTLAGVQKLHEVA